MSGTGVRPSSEGPGRSLPAQLAGTAGDGSGDNIDWEDGSGPPGGLGIGLPALTDVYDVLHGDRNWAGPLENLRTISPTQLSANTDNWNPTGLATAEVIRASTDASRNLTGIVAPATPKVLLLENIGAQDLVLKHNTTSTAANRFYCPNDTDVTVQKDTSVWLGYDLTSARWRVVGMSGGGSTSFGTPALTLGTSNAAGSASTAIRTDATILAFDATTPATQAFGDAGTVGTASAAAHRDHKHPMPTAAVTTSGLTQATGKMLGRTTASTGAIEEITVGTGLSLSAGSLTATGSGVTPDNSGLTPERKIQPISDYVSGYDTSAGASRGFPVGSLRGGPQGSYIFDECYYNATLFDGGIAPSIGGTGVLSSNSTPASNHPGVVELNTGGGTTGRATLRQVGITDSVRLGGGKYRFGCVVQIPTLSVLAQRFETLYGTSDVSLGSTTTNGVYFSYTDTASSGNWECHTKSGGGAGSTINTALAVVAGQWYRLEYEVNAAGTSVEFFIDDVSYGTLTTNIPTAGNLSSMVPATIGKSLGTTARNTLIDAYWYHLEFTTAR